MLIKDQLTDEQALWQRIRELEREIDDMMNVDYGVLIQLAIDTDLDETWNRANIVEREHIKDVLKGLRNDI